MAPFRYENLSRVTLVKNSHYKRDGLKSYGHLLVKYNITPTIEGPFSVGKRLSQIGKPSLIEKYGFKLGGKAHIQAQCLMKEDSSGKKGEVNAMDIQNDTEYLATVAIGSPPQKFNLDFDTGSADLWVWSSELDKSTQNKANHNIFKPEKSTTWQPLSGQTWQIQYGDGSTASGTVGTDTLQVGGLIIYNQAIELAEQLSSAFASGAGDGLLGLAWGNINTVQPHPVKTPVENMITQEDIPQDAQLFTAHLGSWHDDPNPNKSTSFYTFGYIDEEVVKASGQQICYTPVDISQGFWQFESASAAVNGERIVRNDNTAIADTGTTLALVDDHMCEAIYSAIPGAKKDNAAQGWIFPSSTTPEQLPTVQFAVGTQLFHVHKEDFSFVDAGNGYVYGGIQSRGSLNFDILGDTFLKGVYAIFDQGNKRFGCVQRPISSQSPVSTPAGAY